MGTTWRGYDLTLLRIVQVSSWLNSDFDSHMSPHTFLYQLCVYVSKIESPSQSDLCGVYTSKIKYGEAIWYAVRTTT